MAIADVVREATADMTHVPQVRCGIFCKSHANFTGFNEHAKQAQDLNKRFTSKYACHKQETQ